MNSRKTYTHLDLHQEFQKLVWNKVLDDKVAINADKRKIAAEKDIWASALVSAFNYLAQDRLRIAACSHYLEDLTRLLADAGSDKEIPESLLDVSDDFFAKLVFTTIDENHREKMKPDFDLVKNSVQIFHQYQKEPQTQLKLSEMITLLDGLAFTLLFHPTFFDESQRSNLVALMADRVAEDVLGEWPKE